MGDWSKFFDGIGQIAKEFSAAREAQQQINPTTQAEVPVSSPGTRSNLNSNRLYPDLNVDGEDSNNNEAAAALVPSPGQPARERRRRNQQRADDEEDWEVLGDNRRRSKNVANNNSGNGAAFAALGVAALGLGAYAAYKSYFNKEDEQLSFVKTQADCIKRLKQMKEDIEEFPVIGFDCQWVINKSPYEPRNPIALLQLATHKGKIMLVPMNNFTSFPQELKIILNNSEIIKTGIEVIKDARYLREDYGLEVQSTYDIRFLAEDTLHRPVGIEGLSKDVLDLDLGRDWEIVNSDWNKSPLDRQQIAYAETAVKASIDIFETLYSFTNSGRSKREVLAYCSLNKDKPFIWDTRKWD